MREPGKKTREKQRLFSYNTENIYACIEKVFDIAALSIIWLIFCLPIITIGASTAALYYTANKVIRQDRGYLSAEFFRAFKRNLKEGTVLFIILAGISFILQLNIGILDSLTNGLFGLFFICVYIILGVLVFGAAIYVFPVLSRFDMSVGWYLKLAMYMTFRYLPVTLVLLAVLAAGAGILYCLPVFILVLPAGIMLLTSHFMEPLLLKHKSIT